MLRWICVRVIIHAIWPVTVRPKPGFYRVNRAQVVVLFGQRDTWLRFSLWMLFSGLKRLSSSLRTIFCQKKSTDPKHLCAFHINQAHNIDLRCINICNPAARLSHLHLCAIWQDYLLKFGHFALMKWYVKNTLSTIFMHLDRISALSVTHDRSSRGGQKTSDRPNKMKPQTEIKFS